MIVAALSQFSKVVIIVSRPPQQIFKGVKVSAYHPVHESVENLKSLLLLVAKSGQPGNLANDRCLTRREIEIIMYLTMGKTSKEIGEILGITKKTVEVHRYNILGKLGLSKTSVLVNYMTTPDVIDRAVNASLNSSDGYSRTMGG